MRNIFLIHVEAEYSSNEMEKQSKSKGKIKPKPGKIIFSHGLESRLLFLQLYILFL